MMPDTEILDRIQNPILFEGSERVAYRDPAAIWVNGVWHLFFTMVETLEDGKPYLTLSKSTSRDLQSWSLIKRLTPYDRAKNGSSPGNIIKTEDGAYVICFQTYCRENDEKYGNENCRLFTMESRDLENWSAPELLRVKGDDVSERDMGRMIDPYIIKHGGEWWCFYKQNGASFSSSPDLKHWTYRGHTDAGENVCILPAGDTFLMFHSPQNGVGVKESRDLVHWTDTGARIFLGQQNWPFAQGRLTAAFVLDARGIPGCRRYIMFCHASGPLDESVYFDTHASLLIAWSDDLKTWDWPGKRANCEI